MATFNWIHFTDVHFGMESHGWLWPKVKHDLLKDIRKLTDKVGNWDVVFFTGDFVQKGGVKEFDQAARELEEFWNVLSVNGKAPVFCAVPGNHDLVRPDSTSAVATALRYWWKDENLRNRFWTDPNCEFRETLVSCFSNYTNWLQGLNIPMPMMNRGVLPGDFSAIITKGQTSIGVVGLNTAFLQMGSGNYEKLLDLHVLQLAHICDLDPVRWIGNTSFSVLLTHHPPAWLAPEALEHFRSEIYPAGRFYSQFCGHLHQGVSYEFSEGGAVPRRLRQRPSTFGLEEWASPTPQKRIHGYVAGQYVINGSDGVERMWPRTTIEAKHGGRRVCPDNSYELDQDESVVQHFEICEQDQRATSALPSDAVSGVPDIPTTVLPLLEPPPDAVIAKTSLQACPRFKVVPQPQHRFIRQEEQSLFEHGLRKMRCVWLVSDWGTGKEGFLSVGLDRFRNEGPDQDVFHIRCDEATDSEALLALFPQQCGMSLQAFCAYVLPVKSGFLLLDGLHSSLCKGEQLQKTLSIVGAVIDYCPDIRVMIISRVPPTQTDFQIIQLNPLDGPEVRTYLSHHPDATAELSDPDIIDKVHERSDGLPMHLDRMLRALKVSSLDSVLEAELEGRTGFESAAEEVPKALVDAVAAIATSQDKRTKRSFLLLKVLSVLPYGETIESLSHYLPAEPFYGENALQLHELALLDVVPLLLAGPKINLGVSASIEQRAPKLLKVPRQIRDYVQTLITQSERDEIANAGAEQFFGRKWREGKIRLRNLPFEHAEHLSTGPGNEFAIIHHLLQSAKEAGDVGRMRRCARLGVWFCNDLVGRDRYRDVTRVAAALLQQLEMSHVPEHWSELASTYGEALRMTGKESEALEYLQKSLEVGNPNTQLRASVLLRIALTEMDLHHYDEALHAAENVKQLAREGSGDYLQAEWAIADITLSGEEWRERLTALESEARKQGHIQTANGIALDLSEVG